MDPGAPGKPMSPFGPELPVSPSGPAGPSGPSGPWSPIGPFTNTNVNKMDSTQFLTLTRSESNSYDHLHTELVWKKFSTDTLCLDN